MPIISKQSTMRTRLRRRISSFITRTLTRNKHRTRLSPICYRKSAITARSRGPD
jgi:hypothetical protein